MSIVTDKIRHENWVRSRSNNRRISACGYYAYLLYKMPYNDSELGFYNKIKRVQWI